MYPVYLYMKVPVKNNCDNCIGRLQLSMPVLFDYIAVTLCVNGNKVCNGKYISQWKFNYYYAGSYFHGLRALELGGVLVKGIAGLSPRIQYSVVQGVWNLILHAYLVSPEVGSPLFHLQMSVLSH
jgi:hypothetical protein